MLKQTKQPNEASKDIVIMAWTNMSQPVEARGKNEGKEHLDEKAINCHCVYCRRTKLYNTVAMFEGVKKEDKAS